MKQSEDLQQLQKIFLKNGLTATIEKATSKLPREHVQLSLGLDEANRARNLILFTESAETMKTKTHTSKYLQCILLFPFHFDPHHLLPLARYLLLINITAAFPGFGLSEPDRAILFKYTLTFPEGHIIPQTLFEFVGIIEFLYDTFAPNIEKLAIGTKSFEEIIIETVP